MNFFLIFKKCSLKIIRPHAVKYKTKNFAPCNKSILANKLLSINLERFLRRIKSPLTR